MTKERMNVNKTIICNTTRGIFVQTPSISCWATGVSWGMFQVHQRHKLSFWPSAQARTIENISLSSGSSSP